MKKILFAFVFMGFLCKAESSLVEKEARFRKADAVDDLFFAQVRLINECVEYVSKVHKEKLKKKVEGVLFRMHRGKKRRKVAKKFAPIRLNF